MTFKKALLCFIFIGVFITNVSSSQIRRPCIDFSVDMKRLHTLQEKFKQSHNPVDRYNYSTAMIDYTERMLEKLKEVNRVYYQPAMLILTDEVKKVKNKPPTITVP